MAILFTRQPTSMKLLLCHLVRMAGNGMYLVPCNNCGQWSGGIVCCPAVVLSHLTTGIMTQSDSQESYQNILLTLLFTSCLFQFIEVLQRQMCNKTFQLDLTWATSQAWHYNNCNPSLLGRVKGLCNQLMITASIQIPTPVICALV